MAKILIADDNRDAADSLAILLALDRHEVVAAFNGVEACALTNHSNPTLRFSISGCPVVMAVGRVASFSALSLMHAVTSTCNSQLYLDY